MENDKTITSAHVEEAENLAYKAHAGQKWLQSIPGFREDYMRHIAWVRYEVLRGLFYEDARMNYALAVAVLHDVLEDCDEHYGQLIQAYFGEQLYQDVLALTKNEKLPKEEQMRDSLERILGRGTPEVVCVKIADRIVNLSVPPHKWKLSKLRSYLEESREIADTLCGKHSVSKVLDERLRSRIRRYAKHIQRVEKEMQHRDLVRAESSKVDTSEWIGLDVQGSGGGESD